MKDVPDSLNKIVDTVLAYRPKPKTKAAKKRKRLAVKKEKEAKPAE
jgi:hypothetical protein